MENNAGAKFLYFLTGLGIGALIGILFAPQSGEQTRELIAGKAEEGRDYLVRKGREVRDQATSYVERGKEAVSHQKEHLTAAIEAGKQAYRAEAPPKSTTD
ncbi:MAG: YtxH domain-containing protein [Acidobacteria bacterium]|nr:YtxH domain-containing protein [Acidobacteriota bacterium]